MRARNHSRMSAHFNSCAISDVLYGELSTSAHERVRASVVNVAISKLTGIHNYTNADDASLRDLLDDARLAALSVRLLLEYPPLNEDFILTGMRLVESHMAIAYTFKTDRQGLTAGYPSEPVVAEAAAQVMWKFRRPVSEVLAQYVTSGMVPIGTRGELVMRLLLIKAFDWAATRFRRENELIDRPVHLFHFLSELFGPEHLSHIKKARPDKCGDKQTFEQAFKDACIRFTHFARMEDDSLVSSQGAWAAIMRGIAWLCSPTQETIDCIIPVTIGTGMLSKKTMTAIFIRASNRPRSTPHPIDEASLNGRNGRSFFPKDSTTPRPYITIVMEFGIQTAANCATTSTVGPVSVPSPPDNPATHQSPPMDHGLANTALHPRYAMVVYGCSRKVYKVIQDKRSYKLLLNGRNIYDDHPRQESVEWLRRIRGWSARRSSMKWAGYGSPEDDTEHLSEAGEDGEMAAAREVQDDVGWIDISTRPGASDDDGNSNV